MHPRYWKPEPKKRKWKFAVDPPPGSHFGTCWSFEFEPGTNGGKEPIRYGDLPHDFDDEENPANALQDVRKLMIGLQEQYDIDPDAVRWFASGGKGLHAEVPAEIIGMAAGDQYLPLKYEAVAKDLKSRFNLDTLDDGIYNMKKGRMWRLPNVKRENGCHKIPLTPDEINRLSMDEITELTKSPRTIDAVEVDIETIPELAALAVIPAPEEKKKSEPFDFGPVTKKRNVTCTKVIGSLKAKGLGRDALILAGLGWRDTLPDKSDFDRAEVEKIVDSVISTDERSHPQPAAAVPKKEVAFPDQVITGAAGRFTKLYCEISEAPAPFYFMGFLTCLGAVISRTVRVRSELAFQPRLFTVLVGESANDRKSTAIKVVVNHFKKTLTDFYACHGLGSGEGLENVLNENKDVVLVFDEFRSFVDKCSVKNSVLLPITTTLFENNSLETHTKKRSVSITGAHLSILAASTAETYERIFTPAFINIGFDNRIFIVAGTSDACFALPPKLGRDEIKELKKDLSEVLRFVGKRRMLPVSLTAMDIYEKWYAEIRASRSIYTRRLDGYCMRIAQLLAINNCKASIDKEIINHAIALCNWQRDIREKHSPIDADNEVARMEEKIRRKLAEGELKEYELKQKCNASRQGLWVFNTALANLKKAGEIARSNKKKTWFLTDTGIL